jgi:hypothetical protein
MASDVKILEIRYFAFSTAAVIDALQAADRENGGTLDRLPVTAMEIEDGAEFAAVLTVVNVTRHKKIRFNAEQIGAALIQYCRLRKIPLPRAGRKSLEMRGGNLCLKLVLNLVYEPLVGMTAGGKSAGAAA